MKYWNDLEHEIAIYLHNTSVRVILRKCVIGIMKKIGIVIYTNGIYRELKNMLK